MIQIPKLFPFELPRIRQNDLNLLYNRLLTFEESEFIHIATVGYRFFLQYSILIDFVFGSADVLDSLAVSEAQWLTNNR